MSDPVSVWRSLAVPSLAALVALAVLVTLGTWQLQRKTWKEGLVTQIEARAYQLHHRMTVSFCDAKAGCGT